MTQEKTDWKLTDELIQRYCERLVKPEKIILNDELEAILKDYIRKLLKWLKEHIKKIKNPYKTMTAEEAGKTPMRMCELETGFEDARQKILECLEQLDKEMGE